MCLYNYTSRKTDHLAWCFTEKRDKKETIEINKKIKLYYLFNMVVVWIIIFILSILTFRILLITSQIEKSKKNHENSNDKILPNFLKLLYVVRKTFMYIYKCLRSHLTILLYRNIFLNLFVLLNLIATATSMI